MARLATRASEATGEPATRAGSAVLGSLTIPGRPDRVGAARSFVAKALGGATSVADAVGLTRLTDAAVLLTSETVTNAVLHSNSRRADGTVTITVIEVAGGVRVEVADDGSEQSIPVVKVDGCVTGGNGLLLVQNLADQWGYVRNGAGTTVWFWLASQQRLPPAE
jgi:anti-sigma regulatory factor (Ser/Thr protein kinase)